MKIVFSSSLYLELNGKLSIWGGGGVYICICCEHSFLSHIEPELLIMQMHASELYKGLICTKSSLGIDGNLIFSRFGVFFNLSI